MLQMTTTMATTPTTTITMAEGTMVTSTATTNTAAGQLQLLLLGVAQLLLQLLAGAC